MPKNRLQKRTDAYGRLAAKYENKTGNTADAKNLKALGIASRTLHRKLTELQGTDNEGNQKTVSQADIQALLVLYENVVTAVQKYTKPYVDEFRELDAKPDFETKAENRRYFKLYDDILPPFDKLNKALSKDINALKKAAQKENLTLSDIYETSKINSTYRVKDEDRTIAMGGQNVRMKLTLIAPDNKEITGYFTPDSSSKLDDEKLRRKAFDDVKKKYGKHANFLTFAQIDNYILYPGSTPNIFAGADSHQLLRGGYQKTLDRIRLKREDGPEPFVDVDAIANTPEKLHIFVEAMSAVVSASSHLTINNDELGVTSKVRANRRNAAMSDVAKMLGAPDLVAEAENVKINLDGKEVRGTFMKGAKGVDLKTFSAGSDIVNITANSLENLSLKKSVADLQILDFLCGNPDRSSTNMFYSLGKDEKGNTIVTSVQGIDNDSSLGSKEFEIIEGLRVTKLEDIKVITRSMAEKVMSLGENDFRQLVSKDDVTLPQVENMVNRFNALKQAVTTGIEHYKKGYAPGKLEKGYIKIVDDNELEKLSFNHDLTADGGAQNHFSRVADAVQLATVKFMQQNVFESYSNDVWKLTVSNYDKGKNIMDSIAGVDRSYHTGSPQYTMMRTKTEELLTAMRSFTGPYFDRDADKNRIFPESLNAIKTKILEAKQACQNYQNYKRARNGREGKETINTNPNHKLSRREKRWLTVENNLRFLEEQERLIEKLESKVVEYNNAMNNNDALEASTKRLKTKAGNENIKKWTEQSNKTAFENGASRSNYLITESAKALKAAKAANNTAEATKAELDLNIKLGFAVFVLPEKDRKMLIDNASKELDKKITADRETLFRKGLASLLLNKKIELTMKGENRNAVETETLKNLEKVPLQAGASGIDTFMNTPEFNAFAEKMIPDLDIDKAKPTDRRRVLNCGMYNIGVINEPSGYDANELAQHFGTTVKDIQKKNASNRNGMHV